MPTYDYLCTVCGHREEVVHGIHAQGPTTCAVCGGPMRKVFVVPAIHFKGSGWAKKDRGADKTRAAAKADAGGDGTSATATKSTEGDPSTGSDNADKGDKSQKTDKTDKTDRAATSSPDSKVATASEPPSTKRSSSSSAEAD